MQSTSFDGPQCGWWRALSRVCGGLALLAVPVAETAQLPVPCVAGSCGSQAPSWVTAGAATAVQRGNTLTVNQSSSSAILNWQSFNISSNGVVTFKQPTSTAVALNEIFQGSPSQILGALNANGAIYLINQNGIIFGGGSQVNVGTLVASSLNVTPQALNGLLLASQQGAPAFASFVDAQGNPLPSGPVTVQAGANLQAANGGQIMLFAPQVQNSGTIRADGGQVILAAGDSVYLAASTDPNLRGLVVQVGTGGTATNTSSGQIASNLGDVTMVGLIVNQMGRVSATTAVQANGSIQLLAQDGGSVATTSATGATLTASNGGTLTLGPDSHTDVLLDTASTSTAVDATPQPRSQVTLNGQQVTLASGSEITATSGDVAIVASASPLGSVQSYQPQAGSGRLVVEPNASINVSGANIEEPVSDNVIAVQLRGAELADSPLQRNGPLRGQTVYVDVRQSGTLPNGTPWVGSPIGDLSGYVADIGRTVAERSLTGGNISLQSDGGVFLYPGSNLNTSGGSIQYLGGIVSTTKVLGTNGIIYDISQAQPNISYVGILNTVTISDSKWGTTQTFTSPYSGQYEPGYVQGMDAGSVSVVAPAVVLDGKITATTEVGPLQRQLPGAIPDGALYRPINQIPLGGELTLGLPVASATGGFLEPDVTFAPGDVLDTLTGPNGQPFDPLTDPLPASLDTVQVRPALLGAGGIAQLDIFANGRISLPKDIDLQLPVAGGVSLTGGAVDIEGSIRAPSGSVAASAAPTVTLQPGAPQATLTLGRSAVLDVSGYLVNDLPVGATVPGTDPLAIAGGTVSLSAGGGTPLLMEGGSLIDVSAGAQLTSSGQINAGTGGSISVSIQPSLGDTAVPATVDSTLRGFALQQGGKLSLTASAICIAAADCSGGEAGTLWVAPSIFNSDGFAAVNLNTNVGGLTVAPGTSIAPRQINYLIGTDLSQVASGTPLASVATLTELPQMSRNPVDVSLTVNVQALVPLTQEDFATAGVLDIGHASQIALDPGGVLALASNTSVMVDGQLSAPGGSISISTTTSLPVAEYFPSQGLWLENGAQVSTQGVALTQLNDQGLVTGSVLGGGSISIAANRGFLITTPGSLLNASGTSATLDVAPLTATGAGIPAATEVASAGGTITLAAAEGMFLNGPVVARSGGAGVAGGTLDVTLDGTLHADPSVGAPIFPQVPHQLVLEATAAPVVVAPGYAVPNVYDGTALLPVQTINAGGFSNVQLTATNQYGPSASGNAIVSFGSILFPSTTTLSVPGSLRLDTPQIVAAPNASVSLSSAYVGLGYDDSGPGAQVGGTSAPGSGALSVHGELIELIGTLGLSGFASTTLDSSGDLRLRGIQSPAVGQPAQPLVESLQAQGSVTLQAAQIYPTTLTQADIVVTGSDSELNILPNGSGAPVLSAGGSLTLQANTIQQGGVLRAPFGQIALNATQLTLSQGSITSTSGVGETIPFGSTQAGVDWVYSLPQGQTVVYDTSGPPAKSVVLQANSIDVDHGATIDVRGGGDMEAFEFVPGTGGTNDVLANSYNPAAFAILPQSGLSFAPYDPQNSLGFSYPIGSSVTLGAGSGVPAGTYAVLPPRYALLPGAYLVTPVAGFANLTPGQSFQQLDGSTVVAGRFTQAGTNSASTTLTQGFDVEPQSEVLTQAQYNLTSANTFFTAQAAASHTAAPSLPMDAGALQFLAGAQLQFFGTLDDTAAAGGRGGQVDISASDLEIVNGTTAAPGAVALNASQINSLNAQSVLIGGERSASTVDPGVIDIQTTASSVSVDPGVRLTGSELILTASDTLTVGAGAQLVASGATVSEPTQYDLTSGGALLRVSTGAQVPVVQTNPSSSSGDLSLAAGSVLQAPGSATLDATGPLTSQATYNLQHGSLAFLAPGISLGSGGSATGNLTLSSSELSSLNLADLSLTSASSIDVYGANTLAIAGSLTLNSGLIDAASADASATLQAHTITLNGTAAAMAPTGVTSSAGLNLQANQISLTGNTVLAGFASAVLDGESSIVAQAQPAMVANGSAQTTSTPSALLQGSLMATGPLTLQTALLTGATGVSFQLTAPAALQVLGPVSGARASSGIAGAGATLALTGSNILVDTAVMSPSGTVRLTANGSQPGDGVTLGSSANIGLAGESVTFDGVATTGPGGELLVNAAAGSFVQASGAQIDVSGGGSSAPAGVFAVTVPQGTATLAGTLTAKGSGGDFLLEANQLPDLGSLNVALNAGGFAGSRTFWQTGTGDVIVPATAGGTVRASSVTVEADGGSVDIQGAIDASGASGGRVNLFAQNSVDIEGTISASATQAAQAGGDIQIAAGNGSVQIASSASIDLSGGAGATGGILSLQVPQSSLMVGAGGAATTGITLAGTYRGISQVQVEGLQSYDRSATGVISSEDETADPSNPIYANAAALMQNAPAISQAVAGKSGLNITLVPGVEIESSGDLTLAGPWDLSTWQFNGTAGILTLRAGGNLNIQQSLSDGFEGATTFVLPTTAGSSWSYRLVAGADLSASNLMAVQAPGTLPSGEGNLIISPGTVDGGNANSPPSPVMVRTGTGSIQIAAAADLEFGNQASVIYTAGAASSTGIPLAGLQNLAYPTGGGNIDINVGGDVLGAPTNQLVNSWLWRTGQQAGSLEPSATGWTVNYQWFEENIGALGGGNVHITAGGDVSELSVAIPTIGVQLGGTTPDVNAVQISGGGNLTVQSGGNITGGSYYVGAGQATLFARGSVGIDQSGRPTATGNAPLLALGDAQFNVSAIDDVEIEGAVNPTLLPPAVTGASNAKTASFFSTYSSTSAVNLLSVAGDVTLLNQPDRAGGPVSLLTSMPFSDPQNLVPFNVYPATLTATALSGNVDVQGTSPIALWPSPTGNLNLLAYRNVEFEADGAALLMSDVNPALMPNPEAPVRGLFLNNYWPGILSAPTPGTANIPIHSAAFSPIGTEDPVPVRVVALTGDVSNADLIYIPKPIHIIAGGDISELNLLDEQLSPADLSVISAGGDISYASIRDPLSGALLADNVHGIVVEGPGSVAISAGGNINLGESLGVTTAGNLFNPALPSGGANVSVMAGATVANAQLAAFTTQYLQSESTYDAMLIAFVETQTNQPVANKSAALQIFKSLSAEQQFQLCQQILFAELTTSGVAAAGPGAMHDNYTQGFKALETLFPESTSAKPSTGAAATYPGSLTMYFSRVYTLQGGNISLLAPGGFVNVGISTPPAAFGITKSADELGVVAQSTGNVNSESYGDFEVNESRVFAADGGNILVWSTDGNIDAGRGAKTAISAPPPTITFDASGNIVTVFPAALTGSGIQALATSPGVSPGNVDLFAPQGIVNANDAGIVAGNITIGATAVLGRNNITFSGVAVGLPVEVSGLGASVASASSAASAANNAATASLETTTGAEAAPAASSALSWLDVFLIGLGEENCKPEDQECLKRQKKN